MITALEMKKNSNADEVVPKCAGVFPPSGHGRWFKLKTSGKAPSPRSGHDVVVIGNKAYLFGGCGCNEINSAEITCLNDVYAFDLDLHHWDEVIVDGNVPLPRTSFGMCAGSTPGSVVVSGGTGVDMDSLRADIVEFDCKKKQWSQILPDSEEMPCSFYGQSMCAYKDVLLLFGGSKGLHYTNNLYAYSVSRNIGKEVQTKGCKPSPRYKHQAVVVDDKMYVLGGGCFKPEEMFIDMYCLDLRTLEWEKIVDMGGDVPQARVAHSCCYDEDANSIYIWGGFTSELNRLQDFCAYHIHSNTWTRITAIAPAKVLNGAKSSTQTTTTEGIEGDSPPARAFHSAAFYNGSLYIFCGANGDERYDDVWRFQVRSTPPSLSALCAHVLKAELLSEKSTRRMKIHGLLETIVSDVTMMNTTSQQLWPLVNGEESTFPTLDIYDAPKNVNMMNAAYQQQWSSAHEGVGRSTNRRYVAGKRTRQEALEKNTHQNGSRQRAKRAINFSTNC